MSDLRALAVQISSEKYPPATDEQITGNFFVSKYSGEFAFRYTFSLETAAILITRICQDAEALAKLRGEVKQLREAGNALMRLGVYDSEVGGYRLLARALKDTDYHDASTKDETT